MVHAGQLEPGGAISPYIINLTFDLVLCGDNEIVGHWNLGWSDGVGQGAIAFAPSVATFYMSRNAQATGRWRVFAEGLLK